MGHMTRYFDIHPVNPQARLVSQVIDVLRAGGLISYPTDSGYALGCTLDNKDALDRIRAIRNLGERHHFTLVCRDFAQLGQMVVLDNKDFRLVKRLTPGPWTFILTGTREVPRRMLHTKKQTVGARIPDHARALALVEELGEPLVTSTLLLPDGTGFEHGWEIRDEIGHLLDAVVEGEVGAAEPTTVVDLTAGEPEVLRAGAGDVALLGL